MNFSRGFVCGLVLSLTIVFSLVPGVLGSSVMWSQLLEGDFNDQVDVFLQTSDEGYIVAGNTALTGDEVADFWVIKTDSAGNKVWNQTYAKGVDHLVLDDLVQTSDGGYAMAATAIDSSRNQVFVLIKTDEVGVVVWEKVISNGPRDKVQTIIETSDGGLAMAGEAIRSGDYPDFWFIKTDQNGNVLLDQTYGGRIMEGASCLVESSDGDFVLGGYAYTLTYDPWLIKVDSNGNMVWNHTFGNNYQQIAHNLVETDDLGYAFAGVNFTSLDFDYWLIKTDVDGILDWNKLYNGAIEFYINHVGLDVTFDGGLALAGSKGSWSDGVDAFLLKIDASGNLQWNQTYTMPEFRLDCDGFTVTFDGGFALAGRTEYYDIFLLKTDENGIIPEFPTSALVPFVLISTLIILIWRKIRKTDSILRVDKKTKNIFKNDPFSYCLNPHKKQVDHNYYSVL